MPLKQWDYAASRARANAADDYFRDLGLDPQNANTSVVGPSGLTMAFGRATNRMLEGNQGRAGTRTLYTPEQQNDYLALHTGSGSVYDSPQYGGERYLAPQWAGPEAGLVRLNATAANRAYTHYEDRLNERRAADEAAKKAAYNDEVSSIRRAQSTVGRLPAELQDVFQRMTPAEKAVIVQSSPEKQYATLAGSRMRAPAPPLAGKGMSTMSHGDVRGINDFLASPYRFDMFRQGSQPTEGVPTMKPLSPVKPTTTLPVQQSTPWWKLPTVL